MAPAQFKQWTHMISAAEKPGPSRYGPPDAAIVSASTLTTLAECDLAWATASGIVPNM
eukprot:CAMPEP_0181240262 /NCGR_PEP_ID=MMETSP1096-20121128/40422_1 /TAXON_ID=156174 ORGANISM="Chrysochromulina ericina, Strain CCMP281" /NCGR_SAMPLE_ID=MMETSP1096 /ASSEMBLY_ACC=CAM_ASM_000453 /LENGTH=57 /DNA_ID=CAMNT_0023336111 /DNA_START=257 /DNA_END=427 /DNA_ORIENTATION=-